MSGRTQVNFGMMEEANIALLGVVTKLDQITDALYKQIMTDFGQESSDPAVNNWDGHARTYFDERRRAWDLAEKEMGDQLHAAAKALGMANDNYKAAEDANRRIWSTA
ncbi:hypothetical protein [Nonomuraea sp. B19D2]|uniref:WXG100 family type VII secretion target n=1 Tax=Nonomuraea sp. B19D2 TaxID=3159561 RepID=UPI0032DA60A2